MSHAVRAWLNDVTARMMTIFRKSNFYQAVHQGYGELGVFGTFDAMVFDEDFQSSSIRATSPAAST